MKCAFVSISCSALLFLTSQIHSTIAAQDPNAGGITAVNTPTCFYYGTTSPADAILALTANQENYGFIQFPIFRNILAVVSVDFKGQPGIASLLFTNGIIGFVIQLNGRVYFLNLVACRDLVPVYNTRDAVFGYQYFYGYQAYQAFAALSANAPISCSTATRNDLVPVIFQTAQFQGLGTIDLSQVQSFLIFQYGSSVGDLQSNVQQILQAANVSVTVARGKGFVNVYSPRSVTQPCAFRPADYAPNDALSTVVSQVGSSYSNGRRVICNYAIRVAEEISTISEGILTPLRIVIPLLDGKLIVTSFYTLRNLFISIYAVLLKTC